MINTTVAAFIFIFLSFGVINENKSVWYYYPSVKVEYKNGKVEEFKYVNVKLFGIKNKKLLIQKVYKDKKYSILMEDIADIIYYEKL